LSLRGHCKLRKAIKLILSTSNISYILAHGNPTVRCCHDYRNNTGQQRSLRRMATWQHCTQSCLYSRCIHINFISGDSRFGAEFLYWEIQIHSFICLLCPPFPCIGESSSLYNKIIIQADPIRHLRHCPSSQQDGLGVAASRMS